MIDIVSLLLANHRGICEDAGLQDIREYCYYKQETRGLDIAGMIADLRVSINFYQRVQNCFTNCLKHVLAHSKACKVGVFSFFELLNNLGMWQHAVNYVLAPIARGTHVGTINTIVKSKTIQKD